MSKSLEDKSLTSESLAALHLLSKNTIEGIPYINFFKQNIMNGALDLLERGYAIKMKSGPREEEVNYRLTPEGQEFLLKIVKYASELANQ